MTTTIENPRRSASSYTKTSSLGRPFDSAFSSALPAAAPPRLRSTAPTRPIAMAGPAAGSSAVAAATAPSSAPPAAPTAPPITTPIALPMPGCSASLVGTFETTASDVPGTRTRMFSGETPIARRLATARSAEGRRLAPRAALPCSAFCLRSAIRSMTSPFVRFGAGTGAAAASSTRPSFARFRMKAISSSRYSSRYLVKSSSSRFTAGWRATGILTSPKLTCPFQIIPGRREGKRYATCVDARPALVERRQLRAIDGRSGIVEQPRLNGVGSHHVFSNRWSNSYRVKMPGQVHGRGWVDGVEGGDYRAGGAYAQGGRDGWSRRIRRAREHGTTDGAQSGQAGLPAGCTRHRSGEGRAASRARSLRGRLGRARGRGGRSHELHGGGGRPA